MEPITVLFILSLSLVAAGAVIAWMVIHQRKGRHEIKLPEDDDTQQEVELRPPTPAAEDRLTTGQEGAPIAREIQSTIEKAQPAGAQEVGRIVPTESQPTAVPETKVAITEEAESTAVRESEEIEGEETQSQSVEEPQPTVVEEVQPQAIKPKDRGGRPRGSTQSQERRTTREPDREMASRRPKPEIVCWKRARQWFIGVEVPEELLVNTEDLAIYQNGLPLSPDDSREACWLLKSISDQVTVRCNENDGSQDANLTFG